MPTAKKPTKASKKIISSDIETIQFRIKRHQINLVLGLLAGLLLGYVIWGVEGSQSAGSPTQASDLASQIETLPRHEVPIDADDPVLGAADAPITIIEFADFQCPYCQRYALETYPQLVADYGDQIRFVYKDFPISGIHPEAFPAALAAQCALAQDAFWEFHDLLFSGRLGLGRESYLDYAGELGLDVDEFTTCLDEERYADAVQADYNFAVELGISSTPTFIINGIALVGAQPYSVFAQIIDYELENPRN
ncbi:MAG TPA: DsbA family protein [Anaerolineales bacterium]|nr:DsbA family protein [Anaerolineales bacterium]